MTASEKRARKPKREPFPCTDDTLDAPDGAKVEIEERGGWFERHGDLWVPVDGEVRP